MYHRKLKMVKIKCPSGRLIPKPPHGFLVPKNQRFYNWPRDKDGPVKDFPDGPLGVEMIIEVPWDMYHRRMIAKGDVELMEESKAVAKEVPSATENTKKDKK